MFSTRGRPRSWERPAFLFLVPLFVAACGGGGGGGSMTSNTTPPTISLSAQPTTVVAGQAVTLTWMSNAWAAPRAVHGAGRSNLPATW